MEKLQNKLCMRGAIKRALDRDYEGFRRGRVRGAHREIVETDALGGLTGAIRGKSS